MIYSEFAALYDELFDPEMYAKWVQFVRQNAQPGSLLDLACGNGRLAIELAQHGFQPAGLDLSADMLAIASQKAVEHAVDLPLFNGDMIDLVGLPVYQTVTCFDDSICYLADENALGQLFEQVANHLAVDGTFLFDVITPYQTDEVYPGYMYNYHDEDRAFMWRSYEGDAPHSVEHDLSFFNYNPAKDAYDEISELHRERTYPLDTYLSQLQAAGFTNVEVSADFGTQAPKADTTRWFFIAKRG
ncbi:class I SAM-dependent methyltransferase [Lactobacillus sp. Sy-1]|uniref:class I SAM-dependent DNA methyltransferase n=1 Tax=Lactobacillus sp. Sy-1 TaxID=2109645 RepID=UPI001C563B6B|nr:class I SAM-dependent methyltransferase [Lactobacillus sp. Sy-1]MBW1605688.1 class I SAM-dependent methyltransferase [Lactobacillus sp. Sy-1]